MRISGICNINSHGYYDGTCCPKCDDIVLPNSQWTTNLYMHSDISKRTDIELSSEGLNSNVQKMKDNRKKKNKDFWKTKVTEAMK